MQKPKVPDKLHHTSQVGFAADWETREEYIHWQLPQSRAPARRSRGTICNTLLYIKQHQPPPAQKNEGSSTEIHHQAPGLQMFVVIVVGSLLKPPREVCNFKELRCLVPFHFQRCRSWLSSLKARTTWHGYRAGFLVPRCKKTHQSFHKC